ncbi:MAG TPA: bifunctional phosphoglucose/phosphomannose isomerase [Candidatus Eremiobacteraeota bacterium]|nr:MAG: bifunctional phosphoglucose/phosphomannose isomerase [bacterium ADurb.Bin363]HPZ06834.1 bifunctional phosphoglucose/phosphomannose isomerase [Candidatus Eremiobacteraeota bacterium]
MPINLNDLSIYKSTDIKDILKSVEQFPEQLEESLKLSKNLSIYNFNISNISIFGMGGSGIGGELLQVLVNNKSNIPILFFHHYNIPKFIQNNSLALIISYSGNTEEILKAYDKIKIRKAKIIVYSSGGKLIEKAIEDNNLYVKIPSQYQPRCALAFLLLPLLYTLYYLNLIPDPEANIVKTIKHLQNLRKKYGRESLIDKNIAKQIAIKLTGKIPLIYSSCPYLDPVAKRWKTQINENAKTLAYYDFFPELCHNTICGWDDREINNYSVIILRGNNEDNSTKIRVEFLKKIMKKKIDVIEEIISTNNTTLEEILSAIYLGDFVSVYLGLLKGVDPSDIKLINRLKEKLK